MKQSTITLKVTDKTKEQMIEYFNDLKKEKTPPYAIFQAKDGDTTVTMYQSGKVVFQGSDADLASDFWIATERINSGNAEITSSKTKKEKQKKVIPLRINSIGSDEVGTGDYFGPIVVTSAYVSKENIDFLLDLGVKDSKKLSDTKIKQIVPEIIKKIPYTTFVLSNKEYNKQKQKNINMNQMKAILHNKVLFDMKSKGYSYDYIVVDQFEPPKSYFHHLKETNRIVRDVMFLTKAEDHCLSVACASLISRYVFLQEMYKLEKELDLPLPLGANSIVDKAGIKIVSIYGKEKLSSIAKLNFKNTDKILNQ